MTSTPVSNLAQAHSSPTLLSKTGMLWVGVIGVLFIAFHRHLFYRMGRIGISDPDWSHVLIIPAIAIYYIYMNRSKLMATQRRVCVWGLPFIIAGVAGYILGIYPLQNGMAQGYSMILSLFGVVLLLLGPAMMRILWFPVAFMVFAIKVSDAIWSIVASKMQGIAAYGAVTILDVTSGITGMQAKLRGSTIDLDYGQANAPTAMNVAEACAGMRMLMAFLALGVALAFLFPRMWWQRVIMILLAAPIAIFVNAVRVAVLGWLHLIDPELAKDDFHLLVGMFMLIPAAGLLMLVGWCLDKILIVEGKAPKPPAPLPFENDPTAFHFDTPRLIRGAGLGAAVVVFLGLSYTLLINRLTDGEVITWLSGGLNTAALALTAILFLAGLIAVSLSIHRGNNTSRLALSQGIIGGLLLAATLGQTSAINAMGVALTKKPLPLRHGIALSFPDQAGDWVFLHQDPRLPKDVEAELDTKHYFNRYYLNTASGLTLDDVEVVTVEDSRGKSYAGTKGVKDPGDTARVHVAYYTGMVDAVPHVPDKCWVVGGQQLVYRKVHTIKLKRDDYKPDPDHPGLILAQSTGFDKTVRLPSDEIETIIFSGADDRGNVSTALYFFIANGNAVASNHNVRFSFNLKDRYSYYCKVEVMFPGVNDPDLIAEHAQELLSDLLPEVMACLPDWTEVQAGTYPKQPQDND